MVISFKFNQFIRDVKRIWTSPFEFNDEIVEEKEYVKPMLYFVVANLLPLFLQLVHTGITFNQADYTEFGSFAGMFLIFLIVFGTIWGILFSFLAPFISGGFVYVAMFLVGVRNQKFVDTFKIVAYSGLISVLYGSIVFVFYIIQYAFTGYNFSGADPLSNGILFWSTLAIVMSISLLGFFHSTAYLVNGLSKVHGITWGKALLGYLIMLAIVFIIVVAVMLVLMAMLVGGGFMAAMSSPTGLLSGIDGLL